MPRRRVLGDEMILPDGDTMMRDFLSPGGTLLGTQTLADTLHKQHKAWQYKVPPSATAGEAAELRKANGMSYRDARKKAKRAEKSEEAPRDSLVVRALRTGIGQGGPYLYLYVFFCKSIARQTDNNFGRTQVTQLRFLAQSD